MRNGRVRHQRGDSGAAAVEFALVLPILLMLVFGIIQFGFILAQQVALNGAVRSGARYGSVNAYTSNHYCGTVVQKTQDASNTVGMGGSQVNVTVNRISGRDGSTILACDSTGAGAPAAAPCSDPNPLVDNPDTLTVKATYDSQFLVPVPEVGHSITLHASGSYQCEYN